MTNTPALLAFDLDGTLLNTEAVTLPDLIICLNEDFGIPITMEQWLENLHGMSGPSMINKLNSLFGTDLTFEAFMPIRNARLEKVFANGVNPAPGVLQVLRTLAVNGHQLCICSNSTYARIALSLKQTTGQRSAGIDLPNMFEDHTFSAIGSIEKPGKAKPAPDVYLAAATRYKVNPAECLAVEDSVVGVQSAINAGFTCWGYTGLAMHPEHEAEKLKKAGAQKIFTHWDDFQKLLTKFKPKKS